ncbi:hypothetical protein ISS86_02465 [Candidatus Microgenomates bacterium]|nr:hypothetical protein [Candidatus Microgenomates bacterium]
MMQDKPKVLEAEPTRERDIGAEIQFHNRTRQMTIEWNLKLDNRELPTPSAG